MSAFPRSKSVPATAACGDVVARIRAATAEAMRQPRPNRMVLIEILLIVVTDGAASCVGRRISPVASPPMSELTNSRRSNQTDFDHFTDKFTISITFVQSMHHRRPAGRPDCSRPLVTADGRAGAGRHCERSIGALWI